MEQCVMTPGTMKMPLWSADSWDSHNMVCVSAGAIALLSYPYIFISYNICRHNIITITKKLSCIKNLKLHNFFH